MFVGFVTNMRYGLSSKRIKKVSNIQEKKYEQCDTLNEQISETWSLNTALPTAPRLTRAFPVSQPSLSSRRVVQRWSSNLHITADSTGSINRNARGKKFDPKKVRLGWGNLSWKFGIWAFSAIFVLFFWVAKNLIYIDNAFNGYSYLKSTRKELSDGTLMLKKE